MMTIAVFSDSHGMRQPMIDAAFDLKPNLILHLGDHAQDADCLEKLGFDVRRVCGNCDPGSICRITDTLEAGGVRIVMTHGHKYHVKLGLDALLNMGHFSGANVLLFGHTHLSLCERRGDILLLNPGTAGEGSRRTCGLIRIENGAAHAEILSI